MMRLYFAIAFFLIAISSFSFAQDTLPPAKATLSGWIPIQFSVTNLHTSPGPEVGASFDGWAHSNSINLPFNFALLRNDFIDDDTKQTASEDLHSKNVFEDGYNVRLFGSWGADTFLFKSPALLGVDYSFGNFSSGQFTDQLFNTVFYGNAYYAGQTADFSGSNEYNFQYSRIGFSLQKNFRSKKSFWQAGAKISLLGIHSATRLDMKQGSLFTEQNGEYLDASYNFEFTVSDSSNHGNLQSDGEGGAIDLLVSWMNQSQHSRVTVYVNDLGFAAWNKKSLNYSADTSVHYEGVEINNFLSHDDGPLFQYNEDSLIKYTGTKVNMGARTFALPVGFAIVYEQTLTHKMVLQSGISYRPYPDLLPLIFVKPKWIINRSFEVAAIASAGGTARYALGFEMMALLAHHYKIILGSDNILGIFIPVQTTSTSLFLQLSYQF
jgi:hypothetical protein